MAQKGPVSAALQSRELNGEVLLEELTELRTGQVAQTALLDLAVHARELSGMRLSEAQAFLKTLAGRFTATPALGGLISRWSVKLKADLDVPLLVGHFERLALNAVVLAALRRANERLPKGGKG